MDRYHHRGVTDDFHFPRPGVRDDFHRHRLGVRDDYRRPGAMDAVTHHRFRGRPVGRARPADLGAYSAAAAAKAAAATDGVAASDPGVWVPAPVGPAVDPADAVAAADDETRHCVARTRAAQHSSDPNNPRC
jgi:hypothetical protein